MEKWKLPYTDGNQYSIAQKKPAKSGKLNMMIEINLINTDLSTHQLEPTVGFGTFHFREVAKASSGQSLCLS